MYLYYFNERGEYTGFSERPLDPVKGGYANVNRKIATDIPVPEYNPSTQIPVWKGARWVVERFNPVASTPPSVEAQSISEVTMAQCRLALYDLHNIIEDEEFLALIDTLPEGFDKVRARLEFRTRPTVRKDNPLVIAISNANGWNLDELFNYAARQ